MFRSPIRTHILISLCVEYRTLLPADLICREFFVEQREEILIIKLEESGVVVVDKIDLL